MGEKGVFVFRRYCQMGASKWIEATSDECGTAIIYVGRARRSPRLDGLRLRPHKIRAAYRIKKKRAKAVAALVQKTLFELRSE